MQRPTILFLCLTPVAFVGAADAPVDFAADVLPVLDRHCTGCHSGDEPKGELVLESGADVLRGGESGPAIVAGKSAESLLVALVEGRRKPRMPPGKRASPSAAEIEILRRWIDEGASDPGGSTRPRIRTLPRIEALVDAPAAITSVAFSPRDALVAIARHGQVELRGAADGQLQRTLDCSSRSVSCVAFTTDGTQVVAAGGDPGRAGRIWRFDVASGAPRSEVASHQDAIYALALSPDGRHFATGSYDRTIIIRDLESDEPLGTLTGHNGAVFGLAFRAGGAVLASASADRTAKLWAVESGERLETFSQPVEPLQTTAFSPSGRTLLAAGADHRVRLWRVSATAAEGSNPLLESRFAHEGRILALAISPDGQRLATASSDRSVKIWDASAVDDGRIEELRELETQPDWPSSLAFSHDGSVLAVGRLDGSFALSDVATGKAITMSADTPLDAATSVAVPAGIRPADAPSRDATPLATSTTPAAKPVLRRFAPRGVRAGEATRVRLVGDHLDRLSAVVLSRDDVRASLVDPSLAPAESWIEITPAAGAPRGRCAISVATAGGESARVDLWIDDIPQIVESEPNDDASVADRLARPALAIPVAVWGRSDGAGDLDAYVFDVPAGSELIVDLEANRIGSKLDATLTVIAPDGSLVATNNDFDGNADPFVAFVATAGGRYEVRVRDLQLGASDEHFYRLSVGAFAFVTACYPLGVPAEREATVALIGHNLAAGAHVTLAGAAPGIEISVPLDATSLRWRRTLRVLAGDRDEAIESEPNDSAEAANRIALPACVNGRIDGGGGDGGAHDADCFRFAARRGQRLVLETDAARRGSPVDTRIEVLDQDGEPAERLLLQATRDSSITFRPIDSLTRDARVVHWEEMDLDELLWIEGEIVKLFRAPQGPDSGFQFYAAENGQRRAFFDTSSTAHALDVPCYIVHPHSPGTRLAANGLPVFSLAWENDDDGERHGGRDSRLLFEPPEDGEWVVRVTDSGGAASPRHAYRLIVREARPDFRVRIAGGGASVPRGSGRAIAVTVDRVDGFEGEVRVDISGLPPGLIVTTPLVVEAGHREAHGTLWAAPDASSPPAELAATIRVRATATIDGDAVTREVDGFGTPQVGDAPKLRVVLEPWRDDAATSAAAASAATGSTPTTPTTELEITPGATVPALLRVERDGYDGLVTFAVANLPHGVIVDNIGLNGVLLPAGETTRRIFLRCAPWVRPTSRPCHAVADQEGRPTSPPAWLHVRAPGASAVEDR